MTEVDGEGGQFKDELGIVHVHGSVLPHTLLAHIPQVDDVPDTQSHSISAHYLLYMSTRNSSFTGVLKTVWTKEFTTLKFPCIDIFTEYEFATDI